MERILPPVAGAAQEAQETSTQTSPESPRLPQLALAVALAVALWDFLFFEEVVGFTRGVFTLAATALMLFAHPAALKHGLGCAIVAGLVVVASSQFVEPTTLAALLSWLGLGSLGLAARMPAGLRGVEWPLGWVELGTRGWFAWVADFATLRAQLAARDGWRGSAGKWLGDWMLPASLSLPFVALFAIANPVIEVGFDDFFGMLGDFFGELSVWRLSLWLIVAAGLWALLRFRAVAAFTVPAEHVIAAGRDALRDAMLVRCLVVFNVLFAVQTVLDAGFFWSGFALPAGMTYAEYAHRGAYPLVATTLLAIFFILTAFHDRRSEGSDAARSRLTARLVHIWLAQNAFLLASAGARLELYVEVYHLTYFRIASAVWMLLVGLGLAFTGWKIASGRTNAWLIDVNLATAAVVLTLCCFPNYDRLMAEYNVEQALTHGRHLDVWYLGNLGPDALPALQRWWDAEPREVAELATAACISDTQENRFDQLEGEWRGRTLRRQALLARIDRSWGAHLPDCGFRR